MFSQISFQDSLVAKLKDIEQQGCGQHRRRSRAAACRAARAVLSQQGYTEQEAAQIVQDCKDMADLELACDG